MTHRIQLSYLALITLLTTLTGCCTQLPLEYQTLQFQPGERVLVVGDSISHSGAYINYLEAYLRTRYPDKSFELFNIGLGSETVAGTSEPDHPFPRPDVHERLGRALEKIKPDTVIACYGMNDGNYYPPGKERFEKFKAGVLRLNKRCEQAGARVLWLTPAAFDAVPLKDKNKLAPPGLPEYSYKKPYEHYDDTLRTYADWMLTLRDQDYRVADVHATMNQTLDVIRKSEPNYTFSRDGIHPNPSGHLVMATAALKAWNMPNRVTHGAGVHLADAERALTGVITTKIKMGLPWPIDPKVDPQIIKILNLNNTLNRCELTLSGLHKTSYEIEVDGVNLGIFTYRQIRQGIDLTQYPKLPINQQAQQVLNLIKKRRNIVSSAWRQHVGHKRPGNYPAQPIDEAMQQWQTIETQIQKLVQPVTLNVAVRPAKN